MSSLISTDTAVPDTNGNPKPLVHRTNMVPTQTGKGTHHTAPAQTGSGTLHVSPAQAGKGINPPRVSSTDP